MPEELAERGVPERYRHCSFANFDAYSKKLVSKLDALKALATGKMGRGVFLFGPAGVGKSHLAVAVMGELVVRGWQGQFIRAIEFAARCQQAFQREETVQGIVGELLDGRFLVLDDVGSERATDFVVRSLFFLVDDAYCRQKVLILTSNLSLEQLHELEPRIASRLVEACELFGFEGIEDYRLRKVTGRKTTGKETILTVQ